MFSHRPFSSNHQISKMYLLTFQAVTTEGTRVNTILPHPIIIKPYTGRRASVNTCQLSVNHGDFLSTSLHISEPSHSYFLHQQRILSHNQKNKTELHIPHYHEVGQCSLLSSGQPHLASFCQRTLRLTSFKPGKEIWFQSK